MPKRRPQNPVLFRGTFQQLNCLGSIARDIFKCITALKGIAVIISIPVGLALAITAALFMTTTPLKAYATSPPDTLNFQARLETSSGAIAPDGNYTISFHLFNAATAAGGTSTDTGCGTDTSCEWTEEYTAGNAVHVANGYLSVNLGSITPFSGINWDQQQYLTMDIYDSGTSSWDGQMSPRLPLTSVPYALQAQNAEQLYMAQGGTYQTLQFATTDTTQQTFVLPDMGATGIYNLMTAPTGTGTTSVGVDLQSSSPGTQQHGSFDVDGTGIVGTLQVSTAGSIDTSSAGTLYIGTTEATGITIGGTTTSGTLTIGQSTVANEIDLGNEATTTIQTIKIGSSSTGAGADYLTIGSGNGASATTLQGGTGNLTLQTGAVSSSSASGEIEIESGANTGAGGTGSVVIESGATSGGTSGNVVIDTGASATTVGANLAHYGFESGTDGWSGGFNYSGLAQSTTYAKVGSHSLTLTTTNGDWAVNGPYPGPTVIPGNLYHISLWIRGTSAGTVTLSAVWVGGSPSSSTVDQITTATTSGWTELSGYVTASPGATNVWMALGGLTASGDVVYLDEGNIDGGSASPFVSLGGSNAAAVVIGNTSAAGGTLVQGGADGVDVATAAGNVITIGTDNDSIITIGDSAGVEPVTLQGNGITQTLTGDSGSGSSDVIKTSVNTTTAFEIQNSGGAALLSADTSGMQITVAALVVSGKITLDGHVVTGGSTPTIAAGSAACTSPTVGVAGDDTSGIITVTTGTGCSAGGTVATVTFASAYDAVPHVLIAPGNSSATGSTGYVQNSLVTTGGFSVGSGSSLTNSTTYVWNYWVVQ